MSSPVAIIMRNKKKEIGQKNRLSLPKWAILFGVILWGSLYLSGCASVSTKENKPSSPTAEQRAEDIVSKLSDEQKIGQLMMIGIAGTAVDADARYMLTEIPCGNVILFDRNLQTPEQVRALNDEIRKTIRTQTGLSPFIGIDQEGGQVMRMRDHLPAMPSAETLGAGSPEETKRWALETGNALKDLGFNINFAPVVDLDAAYERSYAADADTVILHAKAAISGYEEVGMATTLKHFPGIGKVKTDPHIDGDTVDITREEWKDADGKPFQVLLSETNPNRTFVMVSNVSFPRFDAENPACLSAAVMEDLLRKECGYTGLILTDDMEMGAMAKHYSFSEMGVRAVLAGADMLLVCHDYAHAQEVFNGLLKAYRAGGPIKEKVDAAVKRIVRVKLENGMA